MGKNKFKQQWSNQTDLGKLFGLSAIALGKVLIENNLKDVSTKRATAKALSEGFAISTPLKDGTPYFMWDKQKIKQLLSKNYKELSRVDFWVAEVRGILSAAGREFSEGNDKMACIMEDMAYDEVPVDILKEVKSKIEIDALGR